MIGFVWKVKKYYWLWLSCTCTEAGVHKIAHVMNNLCMRRRAGFGETDFNGRMFNECDIAAADVRGKKTL